MGGPSLLKSGQLRSNSAILGQMCQKRRNDMSRDFEVRTKVSRTDQSEQKVSRAEGVAAPG